MGNDLSSVDSNPLEGVMRESVDVRPGELLSEEVIHST